jgi:FkbM family methyltransferase
MNTASLKKGISRGLRYNKFSEKLRSYLLKSNEIVLDNIALKLAISPGDVVLDCGANVGDVTSKFARSGATVYAFEPNKLCFDIITKRFALMSKVHCLNNGIMDCNCQLDLATPEPHAGFDALETTVAASFKAEGLQSDHFEIKNQSVKCVDADQFIRSIGKRVRLMKIDIEGAEIEVINRLIDTNAIDLIDYLVVETHEKQMPHLLEKTNLLRSRINSLGLDKKINLDWY